jgi:hypothetical protein
MNHTKKAGLLSLLSLVLCACEDKAAADKVAAKPTAAATAATTAVEEAVAAVLTSNGPPSAQLKFVLPTRPLVGIPFQIKLLVTAAKTPSSLALKPESLGLKADPLAASMVFSDEKPTVVQEFMLTALQPGLMELIVHVIAAPEVPETTYVLPILVAEPGQATGSAAAP